MAELSEADRFLLKGIRQGDGEAWRRLVERYRGRLLAFAQRRLNSPSDAEDVLQETFMGFLRALPAYRGEAGLETFLFTLLRRKIVDFFRGRRRNVCLLHDVVRPDSPDDSAEPIAHVAAPDPTASLYVRRSEQDDLRREALAEGVRGLVNACKKTLNFRDLKIVEMLFYCHLANKEVARVAQIDERQIALIKHRGLKKIRENVTRALKARGASGRREGESVHDELLLADVWESARLSCPKRSTIGALVLGTLEGPWRDYVDFHLNTLGCRFCLANYEDLKAADARPANTAMHDRILQSTIGFLRQSYRAGR